MVTSLWPRFLAHPVEDARTDGQVENIMHSAARRTGGRGIKRQQRACETGWQRTSEIS